MKTSPSFIFHPRHLMATVLALCAFLSAGSCRRPAPYVSITGYAQGGTYTVKLSLEGVDTPPLEIKAGIDSILTLIDTTLSGYNETSMLSRFNSSRSIVPNDMFLDMYMISREFYTRSGGALDMAAGPLFDEWGFGFKQGEMPSEERVKFLRDNYGMDHLPADREEFRELCLKGGCGQRLNYNAIAQGFSCDVVAKYLYSLGAKSMLVDIGEIFCDGLNPNSTGWSIAVDKPVDGNQELGAQIQGIWQGDGSPRGVVTSGNYRKFYVVDGKKYAHTIDPRTGYPARHSLLSATVAAPDATSADALATWCMVLGLEGSKTLLEEDPTLEGYLIYEDGEGKMRTWASEGFNLIAR